MRLSTLVCAACTLALSSVAATASAQSVDVQRQDVSVDLRSSDSVRIELDLTVTATAVASQLSMFAPMVPVESVEVDGVAGQAIPHPSYPDQVYNIVFPETLSVGQQAEIHLVLAGEPACPSYNAMCTWGPGETVLSLSYPGSAWYVYSPFYEDPFLGDLEVLAPSEQVVLATHGAPLEVVELPDGATRWRYTLQHPADMLALYAGEAEVAESTSGFPVSAVFHSDEHDPDDVTRAVEIASEIIPIYEELYQPLPVDRANILTVPNHFAFGGMGLLGTVLVNGVVFSTHDYLVEQGMAHEFAHSWWGNLASGASNLETPFLHEAFAEYSAWRALGLLQGKDVRTAGMRMNAVWYMYTRPNDADVAILSPGADSSPVYVHVTYHKGPLVLRALEEMAGEEGFADALRLFVARGSSGLSISGLIEDVQSAAGYDATAHLQQWLFQTGFPRLLVTPVFDGERLSLSIDLEGEMHATVPLRIVAADGTVEQLALELAPGLNVHDLAMTERPAAVQLDPDWTLVREVNPTLPSDVTLDGQVDGADLLDMALHHGGYLPATRRVDGGYDPLYDVNRDGLIDDLDLDAVVLSASSVMASRAVAPSVRIRGPHRAGLQPAGHLPGDSPFGRWASEARAPRLVELDRQRR